MIPPPTCSPPPFRFPSQTLYWTTHIQGKARAPRVGTPIEVRPSAKRRGPGDLSGTSSLGLEVTITSDFASFRADSLACSNLISYPPRQAIKHARA